MHCDGFLGGFQLARLGAQRGRRHGGLASLRARGDFNIIVSAWTKDERTYRFKRV